jgi:hypothetical protein
MRQNLWHNAGNALLQERISISSGWGFSANGENLEWSIKKQREGWTGDFMMNRSGV